MAVSDRRSWAVGIAVVAALLLLWMVNPWLSVPDSLRPIVTVAFWVSAIALLVVLYLIARATPRSDEVEVEGLRLRGSCSTTPQPA